MRTHAASLNAEVITAWPSMHGAPACRAAFCCLAFADCRGTASPKVWLPSSWSSAESFSKSSTALGASNPRPKSAYNLPKAGSLQPHQASERFWKQCQPSSCLPAPAVRSCTKTYWIGPHLSEVGMPSSINSLLIAILVAFQRHSKRCTRTTV